MNFLLNKYYTVKGNHDDEDFPVNIILEIGKYRLFNYSWKCLRYILRK